MSLQPGPLKLRVESTSKNSDLVDLFYPGSWRLLEHAVIHVYDAGWERDQDMRAQGRFQRVVASDTKSRHAVKRDGSLREAAVF
jgi:hypothetical protein